MAHSVCPVWIGYLLLSPFRKLRQNPQKILQPYVKPGMTAMDFGSAMGFFSIPMAKYVGETGRVISVDVQEKMLRALKKRARKFKVDQIIDACLLNKGSVELNAYKGQLDFILLFAVVHEVPEPGKLFNDLYPLLKESGKILFAEPAGHITKEAFTASVALAQKSNFLVVQELEIGRSHSVLLQKNPQ